MCARNEGYVDAAREAVHDLLVYIDYNVHEVEFGEHCTVRIETSEFVQAVISFTCTFSLSAHAEQKV